MGERKIVPLLPRERTERFEKDEPRGKMFRGSFPWHEPPTLSASRQSTFGERLEDRVEGMRYLGILMTAIGIIIVIAMGLLIWGLT